MKKPAGAGWDVRTPRRARGGISVLLGDLALDEVK